MVHTENRFESRARWILTSFLFTFMAARILVFLIASRRMPDIYLHLGGTHVHHLNYGIFLLSAVGAYLLLRESTEQALHWISTLYGAGLALTFDEFGLWLHLGGSYWQRASFDAIVVILALLGLLVWGPRLRKFRPQHWVTTFALTVVVLVFAVLLVDSFHYAHQFLIRMQVIEQQGPPLR